MGTRKRLLYFIILNIVVSAVTTWIVASMVLRNYALPEGAAADLSQSGGDAISGEPVDEQAASGDTDLTSGELSNVAVGQLEIDTVIGAGDLDSERVLVRHTGEETVMMIGWQLTDEDGNVYNFPALTMFPGGAITVYTKAGDSDVVNFYWGLGEAVWREGETVSLIDPNGNVQAVFTVP